MQKKYIIIIVILLIASAGAYIGITKYREQTPDTSKKKPDVVITAKELIASFDQDTAAAKKRFVDKLIEVSGMVVSVDTTGAVVLGEAGDPSAVTVSLDRRHIDDHKKLEAGTMAVLKGICTGYSKGSGDDLLASLGTTVELNFASVQNK